MCLEVNVGDVLLLKCLLHFYQFSFIVTIFLFSLNKGQKLKMKRWVQCCMNTMRDYLTVVQKPAGTLPICK